MAKSTKIIAALGVVAGLGVAAMPLASYAAGDGANTIVDEISVEVAPSCKFTTGNSSSVDDGSFTATNVANGTEVTLSNNGTHKYNAVCNTKGGYTVKATATGLNGKNGATSVGTIGYVGETAYNTAVTNKADDGAWYADITGATAIANDGSETTIIDATAPTSGTAFTATYHVYVGEATAAGTYTGNVTYILTTK